MGVEMIILFSCVLLSKEDTKPTKLVIRVYRDQDPEKAEEYFRKEIIEICLDEGYCLPYQDITMLVGGSLDYSLA